MRGTHKEARKVVVTSALVTLLIGLTLFLFESFEAVAGHGISIASFGATALIVILNPTGLGSSPKAVFFAYMTAGLAGLLFSSVEGVSSFLLAALAAGSIAALQVQTGFVHPPAVAYSLSYFYGGYSISEFFLTIPALLSFFIALGVLAFVLEITVSLWERDATHRPFLSYSWPERVDAIIPYALVVLFISLIIEFVYSGFAEQFHLLFSLIDWSILVLFAVDLFFKYQTVHNTLVFLKRYWLDILATVPVFFVLRFVEGVGMLLRFERLAVSGGARASVLPRMLKPMARFPRFAKLIERIEQPTS